MPVVEVFKALGEPTRLKMVERLSHKGPHTITSLCEGLSVTRQGARKHLQILADSHIITLTSKGRETNVELDPDALLKGKRFIAELETRWEKRLEALRDFVEKQK